MKIDKRDMPVFTSLVVSFIVFTVLYLMRESAFREQALFWILWVSLALVATIFIFFAVAQLLPKLRKSIWVSDIPNAVIIYFGVLIISLGSFYKDLLLGMSWDPSMIALGIALSAFGWGFFTQRKQLLQTKETSESLRASISDVGEKVVALDDKFTKLENVINAFPVESKKLAKGLTEPQKEDNGKDN